MFEPSMSPTPTRFNKEKKFLHLTNRLAMVSATEVSEYPTINLRVFAMTAITAIAIT